MKIKELKNLDKEDIWEMLGIKTGMTITGVLWRFGLVAMSAVAGGMVVLLLAPRSRQELREKIGRRARETADDILTTARAKANEVLAERG